MNNTPDTPPPGPADGPTQATVPTAMPTPLPVSPRRGLQQQIEHHDRLARLGRLNGPGECTAAVLALLLTGSRRERRVWDAECAQVPEAARILEDVTALAPAEQLPWLERLAGRLLRESADDRRNVLRAARRLMAADGRATPRDRLRWLGLRHAVTHSSRVHGEASPLQPTEMEDLDEDAARAVARFSAFLSRLVPQPAVDMDLTDDPSAPGDLWWRAVVAPWPQQLALRERPDSDDIVNALQTLQALPWMLQPVLVRRWVDAAAVLSPPGRLHPEAADALRIAARLLDSPLPPVLAACFEDSLPL